METIITYESQAEVIKKAYLSKKDIQKLVPLKGNKLNDAFVGLKKYCDEKSVKYFTTLPNLIPTEITLEYFGLDRNRIVKLAEQSKKSASDQRVSA